MYAKQVVFLALCSLFLITATAQQKMDTYEKAWKKVDSLIQQKGLPQSAFTEVNKIYAQAKLEKNDAQQIKALIYRARLREVKEEAAELTTIKELETEAAKATEPARSILQSITAGMYWSYFQQHRWQLYNRTTTVNYNKTDIATWSTEDFHQKIGDLYLASLKNEKLLQQTRLERFDPIINKGNARYLRPTLFDLLAHQALSYFKSDERNIRKAADAFEMDDPIAFADAPTFVSHKFKINDSVSLQGKALLLYQRLLRFHLNDTQPDALVDANINRLEFVNKYSILDDKQVLYRKALEQVTNAYGSHPSAAQAWFLLAQTYYDDGSSYDPLSDTTHRYALVKAKEICEKIAAQKDSSEGKSNCINLLNTILSRNINLQSEKVNIPGQPFRVLVTWRNVKELHFRVVKMDKKVREGLGTNTWEDAYWKKLINLPVLKTFTQPLPDTKDHQQHHAEIKAEGLPVGEYAFIVSADKDFTLSKNVLAVQSFYISNLSYIRKNNDYFVLQRETGAPVARAAVQVWYRNYDYNTRQTAERMGENLFTDKNGYFTIVPPKTSNSNYSRIEISTKEDHLSLDEYTYNYQYPQPKEEAGNVTYLFTDRSIYRPGQIVYFKGIVINRRKESGQNALVTNFATTIGLYDVNDQLVDSVKLTTGTYGSFSGRFTLPTNVLNGNFSIKDLNTNSTEYFSVEEYKRPTFSTEIAKPAGSYRLNDSIEVTGTAKAYAGNNIDGATVKYRVVRKTIMPLWYGFGKMIWPPVILEDTEIAHGTTTTRTDGSFTISFKALPDLKINKKDQPTFLYEMSADVTDISGETRSGSTTISVAYQALRLNVAADNRLHTDSIKNIKVSSTNFNNLFEQATVTFTMHKLKTPGRIFRERYWQQPDQFVMTQQEYYAAFPYDIYKNEHEIAIWEKEEKVLEVTDTTTANGQFSILSNIAKAMTPGWYVIEVNTKDKFGETVKALQYIELYNKPGILNPLAYGSIALNKSSYEPGETVSYQLTANLDSLFVIQDIEKKGEQEERKLLALNGNSPVYTLPVTENDRGGLGIQIAFVKHNRIYSSSQVVQVPYSNKDLTIAYSTYRDKTLPGSAEKWKVKISGNKGDQVAAEMLTAMYDASLDQFKPHKWQKHYLWPGFSFSQRWQAPLGFQQVHSQVRPERETNTSWFEKSYDQLIGSNQYFAHNQQQLLMGRVSGIALEGNFERVAAAAPVMKKEEGVKDKLVNVAPDEKEYQEIDDTNRQLQLIIIPQPTEQPTVQPRKNFNETAFFFPDLHTDAEGNVEFSFTMPEALTQWKWMILTHTQELALGYSEQNVITQKELMVQPNAPRFMREGDRMDFSGKIVNLSDKELTGQVELQLIDPTTNQSVDGWFRNVFPNQFFTVAAGQSTPISFSLEIPYQYNRPVSYRLIAATRAEGNESALSDGEENMLPIVSNRLLVTESLPLPVQGKSTKAFTFDKLLKSGESETLNQHALTVEFTSNPAWYAVQALPYLMEYPYECAEQVFNRYYANTLAASIANASPRIKAVFERWKTTDTAALLSNLQKNEALKAVLLQETPWVLEAKSEAQQKKNIALLFDIARMSKEQQSALRHLQDLQSANGGFVWFQGGPDDRYITQYILTGIGRLKKLNALKEDNVIKSIVQAAIPYLDKAIKKDYDDLLKNNKGKEPVESLNSIQVHYLYMRSFFQEYAVPGESFKAYHYFRKQVQTHWLKQSKYMQGMLALAQHRTGDTKTATSIMASLKQHALINEEMGMYWKATPGYYWYQNPIESQALMIEAFTEVTKDMQAVAGMKTWLLKQKQTQNWKTTKATADACYALLLQGTNWLAHTPEVRINLGNYAIRSADQTAEKGTGYFKKVIDGKNVNPEMGNIQVSITSTGGAESEDIAWGAVYWQYFENLDQITSSATPLQLTKKLFVEKITDRGPVLQPVNEGDALQVGDKIKVRIELRVDRNMEYVHMKDMRAACMEPVNVLSSYKWQGGLGYYESTKDASTNFFFGFLPKGSWVFEYPLFVTHTGTFSNGITSIQCMYAPEFTSHSEGIKVNVEAK